MDGYKGVDGLYNFFAFEDQGKHYLFFLTGFTLTTYEVSFNGDVKNEQTYSSNFFSKFKIYLEDILHIPGNKFLLLDFYSGVIEIEHSVTSLTALTGPGKMVYDQYGCRHMTAQNEGEYLALQCSLTQKTFFILQLVWEQKSQKFSAQQPIFFDEVLTGISSNS
jgi:hypothetical protein